MQSTLLLQNMFKFELKVPQKVLDGVGSVKLLGSVFCFLGVGAGVFVVVVVCFSFPAYTHQAPCSFKS
jgi:hypothetical protein